MAWTQSGNIRGPQGPPGSDATVTTAAVSAAGGVIGTGVTKIQKLTAAQYTGLTTKDANTLYLVVG